MAKIPFYKIGSALKQNGKIDPNSGKAKNGEFKTYTDPVTGEKTDIEYKRGNLGRTREDAFAKRDMNTYGDMKLKEYTDFSKKQKAHYRTTGVWLSPDEMNSMSSADTSARNGSSTNSNSNSSTTITSSGGGTNTDTNNGGDGIGKGIGTFKEWLAGKNNNTSDGSGGKIDINKPITFPEVDLSGGRKAGLVRQFESQKGFSGDVLDKEIAKTTDAQSIRRYARGMKDKALSAGATRREAKHHKMLGKALAHAQDAGMTLKETDAKGNVVNESVGEKSTSIVGDGKARKKAAKFMRRANRLAHRMQKHEGHNMRKGDVGSQYYGEQQKYNQVTAGDQRRGSRPELTGGVNMIKNNLSTNNGNAIGNNATRVADVKHGSDVKFMDTNVVKTANITGRNKKQGAV